MVRENKYIINCDPAVPSSNGGYSGIILIHRGNIDMSEQKKYRLKQWYPSLPKDWEEGKEIEIEANGHWSDQVYFKHGINITRREVTDNPEFWEKVEEKDYEILSFQHPKTSVVLEKYKNGLFGVSRGKYAEEELLKEPNSVAYSTDEPYKIHSVRKKSNDKIFTIEDRVKSLCDGSLFKIKKIDISDMDDVYFKGENAHQWNWLHNLNKVEKPLFISEDDVDVYKGETYFVPQKRQGKYFNEVCAFTARKDKDYSSDPSKRFASREAAEEFLKEKLDNREYTGAEIREALHRISYKIMGYAVDKNVEEFHKDLINEMEREK